jgi:three-Cys-motif partner protein
LFYFDFHVDILKEQKGRCHLSLIAMNRTEYFASLKPWSKRKHRLLEKYLKPFTAKVATATSERVVYCVDAFAGAAKYDDGSEGSPLLIAKLSDECANWTNPVHLMLINIEADIKNEGTFSQLEKETADWKNRGIVKNINKQFHIALPEVLNFLGYAPTLFFIDPFGPTAIHFSYLEPILKRSKSITELIINFDTDGLRRILDAALSENTNPKAAKTNRQTVTEVLGSSNWQDYGNKELSTNDVEQKLLNQYLKNFQTHQFCSVAYPIRESLNKKAKYHFVYCTRHQDGMSLMNDFMRKEDDRLYEEYVKDSLPLFPAKILLDEEIESRRSKLKEFVLEYLGSNTTTTRGQIKRDLITLHFGRFDEKDYNFVVKDFFDKGYLKARSGKARINDSDILDFHFGS